MVGDEPSCNLSLFVSSDFDAAPQRSPQIRYAMHLIDGM